MERRPLRSRLRRDFWRPDDGRVWVRKEVGWGWTVNFHALRRKLRRR
ncbi:MAG TPA: hypothetical protein VEY87_00150 [Gaiellaceae bacterium]|nr:hypothetical protein [Gaiellaceae bacterium]